MHAASPGQEHGTQSRPLGGRLALVAALFLVGALSMLLLFSSGVQKSPLLAAASNRRQWLSHLPLAVQGTLALAPAPPPEETELQQLVGKLTHHMQSASQDVVESTVIMTIVDTEGSQILLPQFTSSLCMANERLARQLVVICVSAQAFEACSQTYATCLYDREAEQRNFQLAAQDTPPGVRRVQSPLFLQIGWDKLQRLSLALSKHAHVFFVDADIVWLSDPMPVLQADPADIQLTHDGWGPNIGVMFLRPTNASLAFMETWLARRTDPLSRDQYEFQGAVDETQQAHNLTVKYVDKARFPNGCCCGWSMPKHTGQASAWVMWHAACIGSLQSKQKQLERIQQSAARLRPPRHALCEHDGSGR